MKKMLWQGLASAFLVITFLHLAIYVSVRSHYGAPALALRDILALTWGANIVVLALCGALLHRGIDQLEKHWV
ncbi:MAG: hypothetical protein EOO15_16370 [Chitinophagaceae bacterium]|nr:MAG: hypothetical protein EOO15_16370 [Chitinophagaceae bacterium]